MGSRYLVVDVETTGSDPTRDEIIEIGLVVIEEEAIVRCWETLIKPNHPIPLRITQLTGITMEMVQDAPSLPAILSELTEQLMGQPVILVGHNINFDRSFLEAAIKVKLQWECLDTVDLSRWVFPLAKNHRLKTLTKLLNINHETQHRALDDAKATASLFLQCQAELRELPLRLVHQITELSNQSNWAYQKFWQELLKAQSKTFVDKKIKSEAEIGITSVENALFITRAEGTNQPELEFDTHGIQKILMPGGLVAQHIPDFEYRIQQVEMVEAVSNALLEEQCLLMEAGTGTGKSLAYLIPALYWAVVHQQKVVVATHTINLQEQLWKKDIPLLSSILPFKFKTALVKGKSNYLCMRKWNYFIGNKHEFEAEQVAFAIRLLAWVRVTKTGDKAELHLFGKDQELWSKLEADRESCLGNQCSRYLKGCFSTKAKRLAESAHLLIVNHSLVFSDIKAENKVLPSYNYLVIDEAHQIEDVATEHLGINVSKWSIYRFLNGLFRSIKEGSNAGILGGLRQRQAKFQGNLGSKDYLIFVQEMDKALPLLGAISEEVRLLFDLLDQVLVNDATQSNHNLALQSTMRLRPAHRELENWQIIDSSSQNVCIRLTTLQDSLVAMAALLDRYQGLHGEEFQEDSKLLYGQAQAALELAQAIDFVLNTSEENFVCWLERQEQREWVNITLKAAPIHVGKLLHEKLFNEKKAVIMSSAPLTVDGDFAHFINRVGLNYADSERILARQATSPFAYEQKALLCICRDIPNPTEIADDEYAEVITPIIRDLTLVAGGKTMVLFTSHRMLREVYWQIRPQLEAEGICVLGHGIDGSRARLIEEFQDSPRAVLFGANSFWEGVDLPGEVLRSVIIVKVPFVPPSMPTVEARLEHLRNQRLDSFNQLTIPQAVIRLKQGFGRLIRTQHDHGVVVILDNRLIVKRYGVKFLRSLPVKNHFRGDSDAIVQKVADWLAEQKISNES